MELTNEMRIEMEKNKGRMIDSIEMLKPGFMHKEEDKESENLPMQLYQLTGEAKVEEGYKFIQTLLENDIKLLIFCHHRKVMDSYQERLLKSKVMFMRIDGSTNLKNRHENISIFQTNPDWKVALLSITAAYQGITLHAANVVVFAEYYWTPGIMVQAEDRVHRVGQMASNVTVYYLHWENTLDSPLASYIGKS